MLESDSGKLGGGAAYLIDYDGITESFSSHATFSCRNRERPDLITHLDGIYRTKGGK